MVHCIHCSKPLAEESYNSAKLSGCPSCGTPTRVDTFPAIHRNAIGRTATPVVMEAEAGCYYHPQKRASVPCSRCGRFLCTLCDVELNGEHICFACLENGKRSKKIQTLENSRFQYDSLALSLSILPMLLFYFTIVTAPVVIFLVLRYWKAPLSIVPRTKIRYVIAFLIATLQIVGWIALIGTMTSELL